MYVKFKWVGLCALILVRLVGNCIHQLKSSWWWIQFVCLNDLHHTLKGEGPLGHKTSDCFQTQGGLNSSLLFWKPCVSITLRSRDIRRSRRQIDISHIGKENRPMQVVWLPMGYISQVLVRTTVKVLENLVLHQSMCASPWHHWFGPITGQYAVGRRVLWCWCKTKLAATHFKAGIIK